MTPEFAPDERAEEAICIVWVKELNAALPLLPNYNSTYEIDGRSVGSTGSWR